MDELTLDGKTYVSSKRAAKITGYAKDYIGQLCREGRVNARLVGRSWYVLEESLQEHRANDRRKDPLIERVQEHEVPEVVQVQEIPEIATSKESDIASNEAVIETPRYVPEDIEEIETVEEISPVQDPAHQVTHMQDAWSAWFNQPSAPEVREKPNQEVVSVMIPEEPSYEVKEVPQSVSLHRIVEAAAPQMDIEAVEVPDEAPVAIRETHQPVRTQRSPRSNNRAAYALIASIVLLFVLMTTIVTGLGDTVFASGGASPLLDLLRGETRIEK